MGTVLKGARIRDFRAARGITDAQAPIHGGGCRTRPPGTTTTEQLAQLRSAHEGASRRATTCSDCLFAYSGHIIRALWRWVRTSSGCSGGLEHKATPCTYASHRLSVRAETFRTEVGCLRNGVYKITEQGDVKQRREVGICGLALKVAAEDDKICFFADCAETNQTCAY